jgi:hypothetical protein
MTDAVQSYLQIIVNSADATFMRSGDSQPPAGARREHVCYVD